MSELKKILEGISEINIKPIGIQESGKKGLINKQIKSLFLRVKLQKVKLRYENSHLFL